VDAFQGHGSLPVKLEANGNKVAANLEWGADSKNFKIVGKASDPTASAAIEADLKAGRVPKFAFTVPVPMVTNAIRTAVLRAAYLLAFKCFGYEYARNDVIQVVRRRIMDRSLPFPQLETLVLQFQNCNIPYDEPHLLARVVVHDLEALLVVLRVRRATTSYLGAFLPSPVEVCNEFFEIMHKASIELDGQTLTIARESLFI
jgi:hypothetical protein